MIFDKLLEFGTIACRDCSVTLHDLEIEDSIKGKTLTFFILKDGGVSIEDCSKVSKLIDNQITVSNIKLDRYFLEVSSPGIERKLSKIEHFQSAINELVKLTISENNERIEIGTLLRVQNQEITINTNTGQISVPFQDIKKANIHFEFNKEQK